MKRCGCLSQYVGLLVRGYRPNGQRVKGRFPLTLWQIQPCGSFGSMGYPFQNDTRISNRDGSRSLFHFGRGIARVMGTYYALDWIAMA